MRVIRRFSEKNFADFCIEALLDRDDYVDVEVTLVQRQHPSSLKYLMHFPILSKCLRRTGKQFKI